MIYLAFTSFSTFEHNFSPQRESELFGEKEKVEFTRLKIPKRKDEWVGSRLVVKKLILACVPAFAHCKLSQIQILKEPSGVPYIELDGGVRLPGWISLSHSREHVLVAYSPDDIRFGVDLEYIEPRSIDFVRDFFTEKETQHATSGNPEQNSIITTVIWSAKEAVLKAISEGLRIDTKRLEIILKPDLTNEKVWNLLKLSSSALKITSPHLMWRREGGFIQTICLLENHDQEWMWVSI
jgi:phosphopantetheinyl transferase